MMMNPPMSSFTLIALLISSRFMTNGGVMGFVPVTFHSAAVQRTNNDVVAVVTLHMAKNQPTANNNNNNEDYLRWAKTTRSADADDNVVELLRPLGLVLQEDENRNVYVETVAPKGNAARTGKVSSE